MNTRHRRSKLVLHLSKPWELGEALGWCPLPAVVDRRDEDRWLVELEQPIRYQEAEYRYFEVSPRLEGWHLAEADSTEVPCRIIPIELGSAETPAVAGDTAWTDDMVGSVTNYRH